MTPRELALALALEKARRALRGLLDATGYGKVGEPWVEARAALAPAEGPGVLEWLYGVVNGGAAIEPGWEADPKQDPVAEVVHAALANHPRPPPLRPLLEWAVAEGMVKVCGHPRCRPNPPWGGKDCPDCKNGIAVKEGA